jgi:hypothetical protein
MLVDPCIIVQSIKKFQQAVTMYQNFIIPYLYEAQHVSSDTPPIIRNLKLHWQPLIFHTWKVVGVGVVRYSVSDDVQQLHVQQSSTYEKSEAAGAVLGS